MRLAARRRAPLAVVVAALVLSGCGAGDEELTQACTNIGARSFVAFQATGLGVSGRPVEVRACVGEVCETSRAGTSGGVAQLQVQGGGVDDQLDDGPVSVSLRVTDPRNGRTLVDDDLSLDPRVRYPNGRGCTPTVRQNVVVARDGVLVDNSRREL